MSDNADSDRKKMIQEISKTFLSRCQFDARFPNMNQTRYCNQNYVDYNRCIDIKGEDYKPCEYFKRLYSETCPHALIQKWDALKEQEPSASLVPPYRGIH
ncbi:hypothetical protein LOTGIDRAFT_184016 [Lottia gigantea]|uniref:Cytochrome c oxidase subunit n=1 Tax=Lottia gigantea TaxID=225164 RepID=V3ZND5_LOTGI|nr:hypothetical protein LOTGIDRAFT_184016 [Lottia gigantea]ESO83970.1 hypothetical protein LOTGIDRAFT_184016 [Lottia gigantea]